MPRVFLLFFGLRVVATVRIQSDRLVALSSISMSAFDES